MFDKLTKHTVYIQKTVHWLNKMLHIFGQKTALWSWLHIFGQKTVHWLNKLFTYILDRNSRLIKLIVYIYLSQKTDRWLTNCLHILDKKQSTYLNKLFTYNLDRNHFNFEQKTVRWLNKLCTYILDRKQFTD